MGDFNWSLWRLAYRRTVVPSNVRFIVTMGDKAALEWVRFRKTGFFFRRRKISHNGLYRSSPAVESVIEEHRREEER